MNTRIVAFRWNVDMKLKTRHCQAKITSETNRVLVSATKILDSH